MKRAAPLALLLGGCSLLGLTDGLEQEGPCGDCSELNAVTDLAACESWECNLETERCEVRPTDGDDDGAPSALCVDEGADCDDDDAENAPGREEVLDGYDNDCDEVADEVAFEPERRASPDEALSRTWTRFEGGFLAIREDRTGLTLLDGDTERALDLSGRGLQRAGGIAAAATGTGVAVAWVDRPAGGSCDAVSIGAVADLSGPSLAIAPELDAGLPKLGGSCPDAPTEVGPFAIAYREPHLLVAVVERAGLDVCGAGPEGAVALTLLEETSAGWRPIGPPASLGVHGGGGPPAIAVVPGLDFAIAIATPEGRVAIHAVDVDLREERGFSTRALHEEPTCGPACSSLALATAPTDGAPELGLAYRSGSCGAEGELRLRTFGVDGAALSPLEAEPRIVGDGAPTQVALAARREAPRWAVAWTDAAGLHAARLGWPTPLASLAVGEGPGLEGGPIALRYGGSLELAAYDAAAEGGYLVAIEEAPVRSPPAAD